MCQVDVRLASTPEFCAKSRSSASLHFTKSLSCFMSPFDAQDPLWFPFCISIRRRSRFTFYPWMSTCSRPARWEGAFLCWTAFIHASDTRTDACRSSVAPQSVPLTCVSTSSPVAMPGYHSNRCQGVVSHDSTHLSLFQNYSSYSPAWAFLHKF